MGADDTKAWAYLRGRRLSGKSQASANALPTPLNRAPLKVVTNRILHREAFKLKWRPVQVLRCTAHPSDRFRGWSLLGEAAGGSGQNDHDHLSPWCRAMGPMGLPPASSRTATPCRPLDREELDRAADGGTVWRRDHVPAIDDHGTPCSIRTSKPARHTWQAACVAERL